MAHLGETGFKGKFQKKMFWFVLALTMAVGCNDGFERDNLPPGCQGDQAPATVSGLVLSDQAMTPIAHQHKLEPPSLQMSPLSSSV